MIVSHVQSTLMGFADLLNSKSINDNILNGIIFNGNDLNDDILNSKKRQYFK